VKEKLTEIVRRQTENENQTINVTGVSSPSRILYSKAFFKLFISHSLFLTMCPLVLQKLLEKQLTEIVKRQSEIEIKSLSDAGVSLICVNFEI